MILISAIVKRGKTEVKSQSIIFS